MEYKQCNFFLFFLSMFGLNEAYTPIGYLGCFDDSSVRHRKNLDIALSTSDTNSGENCMQRCSTNGYRYAGTKNARQCHCGTRIKINQQTYGCVVECTGREDEHCGGSKQISIYDTWQCVKKPCPKNARCEDIDSRTYTCSCIDGWQGENCTQEVQTSSMSSTSVETTLRKSNKKVSESTVFYTTSDTSTASKPTTSTLLYTYTVSTNVTESTTNAIRGAEADVSVVSRLKAYVWAPAVLIVLLIVVVIPTFVIRKRWKGRIKRKHDNNYQQNGNDHYDNIYNRTVYSQPSYMTSGTEHIYALQLRTSDSSDMYVSMTYAGGGAGASNIAPTSDSAEPEYTYIDEASLSFSARNT